MIVSSQRLRYFSELLSVKQPFTIVNKHRIQLLELPPIVIGQNNWTKRLLTGIQKLFTKRKVEYTAEMGQSWHDALLSILGIGTDIPADVFLSEVPQIF